MSRLNLLAGATALLLAGAVAAPAVAQDTGTNDRFTEALLQRVQAPAPAPQGNIFSNITLGQVLGTMTGAVVGKVVLESALDLPMGVGVVAGAIAGYYVWVKYIGTMEGPSIRKTSGTGYEGRMFLIGDAVIEHTSWLLQPPRSGL